MSIFSINELKTSLEPCANNYRLYGFILLDEAICKYLSKNLKRANYLHIFAVAINSIQQ